MRVRPLRPTDRRPLAERRPHVFGRPAEEEPDASEAAPEAPPAGDHHLQAERRHRASVAPEDHAHYGCSCGFQFQAPVSTSVSCPHCGTAQAW
ncbi:MAG TPA: hypothetical protein VK501_05840 [Baekduia sp.]|uniref:hypothetical protein n=1 Tax=Baekduia sp. TaxID=2600305 RepID=UPI002C0FA39D|nr:hypothetical protein [Baekduia sp.]HMJ33416.1 hypothetical protein [Baekduia sp.]